MLKSGRHRDEDPSAKPCMGDKLLGANTPTTNHNHSFALQESKVGKTAVFHVSKPHVQTDICHPLPSLCWLTKCFQWIRTESHIVWDRTTKAVWSAFIGIYSVANGWVASLKLLRRGRERDPSSGTAPMGKEGMWLKYKTLVLLHWQALNVQTVIRSAAVWSLPSKEEGFYINKSLVRWSNLSLLLKLRLSKLSLECNSFLTYFIRVIHIIKR